MPQGVTVVTPTGGRPEAFALCERWMARQDYRGEIQWIIVNDVGDYEATLNGDGRVVLEPEQLWEGANSQHRNLLLALDHIRFPKIVMVEDDDWYAPGYVSRMVALLEEAPLVGQIPTICYNVRWRAWLNYRNVKHASLCQTAFREEVLPDFRRLCEERKFLDLALFRTAHERKLVSAHDVVSIKGLPGREGVMPQHRVWDPRFMKDQALTDLREFVGEDFERYESFNCTASS
jgi:hypothetical protein